ncbi:hypothetical protein Cpap_4042 [Ruminiclostridium papyrosolvens DSM 2782]|uniref:Uncharacterized protein n=1 Tax=Ruminiclostridium papyrosolvens DSM 2782 TaxID=588581 RepID=F1T804_9FIRM|nr:hypothetical protein Cpap_4042 [Ruminiclostridium papyrosolvens DSM 2782]
MNENYRKARFMKCYTFLQVLKNALIGLILVMKVEYFYIRCCTF